MARIPPLSTGELFDRLRRHFSPPRLVELTLRIILCGFFNTLNQALRIDVEPEAARALAHGIEPPRA